MTPRKSENHISFGRRKAESVADELDQDVQALGNWLRDAWRFLASDPSLTPFDRRELRNSMKHAEATLRLAISPSPARENATRQTRPPSPDRVLIPDFRVLASFEVNDVQARLHSTTGI
jgi:hypothetical protein